MTASMPRCYTIADLLAILRVSKRTFHHLKATGRLPFVEELRPRIGHPRYRADLVDRWLQNDWRPTTASTRPLTFGQRRRA
jgi:hypothetical protein